MPDDLPQRLLALVSRAGALLGSPRMEDVLPGILAVASQTLSADGYAVWRLDRALGAWTIASHAGVSAEFARNAVSTCRGGSAAVAAGMQPIVAEDVRATALLAERTAVYEGESIVSMLARTTRRHGGTIQAESDGDGRGTTFRVACRRRRERASRRPPPASAPGQSSLEASSAVTFLT